jgi:hypothetical protein
MSEDMYPSSTRDLAQKRRELAPETEAAFQAFSQGSSQMGHCRQK